MRVVGSEVAKSGAQGVQLIGVTPSSASCDSEMLCTYPCCAREEVRVFREGHHAWICRGAKVLCAVNEAAAMV